MLEGKKLVKAVFVGIDYDEYKSLPKVCAQGCTYLGNGRMLFVGPEAYRRVISKRLGIGVSRERRCVM